MVSSYMSFLRYKITKHFNVVCLTSKLINSIRNFLTFSVFLCIHSQGPTGPPGKNGLPVSACVRVHGAEFQDIGKCRQINFHKS